MSIFLEEVRDAEAWFEPGGHDRCSKRAGQKPWFIVQKARRKALTHSSLRLAPPMMPAPYLSITVWLNSKTGTTEVIPGLAEKWDISEDGKTYTFHLRKGVKWQSSKDFKTHARAERR
ncbi:peptide ABC transporter substrate-binding protein [Salmonella enterica subsp. enterica serovar Typhi]|nr:peptide ABC transporter substrate-binding protein [Salmonella enterica subsp. enterica serovar Typhi]